MLRFANLKLPEEIDKQRGKEQKGVTVSKESTKSKKRKGGVLFVDLFACRSILSSYKQKCRVCGCSFRSKIANVPAV